MGKILPFRQRYYGCDICFMDYDEPRTTPLCWQCQQRCLICNAAERRCENPNVFALNLQPDNFTRSMNIHRKAGEELWWFGAMETINEAINEKLTDAATVAAFFKSKAPDKPILQWDESLKGFGIRINRDGTTMFICRYSLKGKLRMETFCDTRLMSIDQARSLVMRIKMLARKGVDPSPLIELEISKTGQIENKTVTFGEFAAHYISHYAKVHKKSWLKDQQRIDFYLLPIWKDRRLNEINRVEVANLHREIGATRPYAANRLTEMLHVIFKQAVYMGFLPDNHPNPALGIRAFREHSRDRYVTDQEMPLILEQINKLKDPIFRAALLLDLMLGFRCSELISLRWDQVDLEAGEIYFADTKAGRTFRQPLPDQAVKLLKSLPSRGRSPWVFRAGSKNTETVTSPARQNF